MTRYCTLTLVNLISLEFTTLLDLDILVLRESIPGLGCLYEEKLYFKASFLPKILNSMAIVTSSKNLMSLMTSGPSHCTGQLINPRCFCRTAPQQNSIFSALSINNFNSKSLVQYIILYDVIPLKQSKNISHSYISAFIFALVVGSVSIASR